MTIRETCSQVRREFETIENLVDRADQELARLSESDPHDPMKMEALAQMLEALQGVLVPTLRGIVRQFLAISAPDSTLEVQTESLSDAERDTSKAFARESEAFYRLLPSLLSEKKGLFVALRNCAVVDQDADEMELCQRVCIQYPDDYVLVRKVDRDEPPDVFISSPHVIHSGG